MGLWFDEPFFEHMDLAALKRERIGWNVRAYSPDASDRDRMTAYLYTQVLDEWIARRAKLRFGNDCHWPRHPHQYDNKARKRHPPPVLTFRRRTLEPAES